MKTRTTMHSLLLPLTIVLACAGACVVDDPDAMELRMGGFGPGDAIGEIGEVEDEIEDEVDDEVEEPEIAEDTCTQTPAMMANNCAAGSSVTTCYSGQNGSKGVCDVYDCDEATGTLYRCEGDLLGAWPDRSCAPQASGFDDCTPIG